MRLLLSNGPERDLTQKHLSCELPHKVCGVTKRLFLSRQHQQNMEKNFAATFVDELFAGPTYPIVEQNKAKEVDGSSSGHNANNAPSIDWQKQKHVPSKRGVDKVFDESLPRKINGSETTTTHAAAWKTMQNACKSLPQLRGVDQRAEEFISKFRQDMKLEREQSLIDFQEMLARSV